ncbi:MAG: calcium/sodium antiporter [Acetobacter sp.]|nr:calcium/sodium antiporter [Bacteroides sp.]MCM1341710.1 calcium/sodium antiporter [Acetobacter sp.]MCM1432351.1 calcium/sodium antiporter [Clostridiales bacterium]
MQTVLMYVLFVVGLILIIKGGDWFVDSASWIAEVLGVPKFVIGATIVSVATTLPEMIVSIQATAKGNVDMAAGNAIGSVTANTAMIMGLFIVCMPFAVKRKEFTPKALMMFGASATLVLGCIFTAKQTLTFEGETNSYYKLSTIGLIVLILIFLSFFIENFISMKKEDHHLEPSPDNIGLQEEDDIVPTKETVEKKDWIKNIVFFILGAAGIVIGADLLVDYGTEIAVSLKIPQRVISVIAIAIGTSLPELVTTITALRKKVGALSVGNILGANIIDLTLILPICSFVSIGKGTGALAVSVSSVTIDMIVCLAAIAVAVFPTIVTKKFSRWQGIVMLAGYLGYVVTVFI